MPESVQVFSRAAKPRPRCGQRLERGPDSGEAIDERLRTAEQELAAQQEFEHVIVNDDLESAAAKLEGIVRNELERDP
jgi:guanylate kinase